MRKISFASLLAFFLAIFFITACKNNSSVKDNKTLTTEISAKDVVHERNPTATQAADIKTISLDCNAIGLKEIVQETCGLSSVLEKNTMEIKGKNCIRSYTPADKQWGEKLVIMLTTSASSFDWMKKEYSGKGMKEVNGIGEAAFTLEFPDKLNGRNNVQLVFQKGDKLVELKTMESPDPKSPCPCYGVEKLKILALKIADKL